MFREAEREIERNGWASAEENSFFLLENQSNEDRKYVKKWNIIRRKFSIPFFIHTSGNCVSISPPFGLLSSQVPQFTTHQWDRTKEWIKWRRLSKTKMKNRSPFSLRKPAEDHSHSRNSSQDRIDNIERVSRSEKSIAYVVPSSLRPKPIQQQPKKFRLCSEYEFEYKLVNGNWSYFGSSRWKWGLVLRTFTTRTQLRLRSNAIV